MNLTANTTNTTAKADNKTDKFVQLVDLERKDNGLGRPIGRTCYRVAKFNTDGTPRAEPEIQADIIKVKLEQAAKNARYLESKGIAKPGTVNLSMFKSALTPHNAEEHPPVTTEFKYGGLNLILDNNTGNTCAIFGSSKRGKSTAMMNIFKDYYANKVPDDLIAILFARNPQISAYSGVKGRLIMCDEFRSDIIADQCNINKVANNKFNFLNLIDDFINLKYSLSLDDLLLTLRNSNISTIICLQYVNTLSKAARSNVNNVLLFGQNTDEAAEVCINVYLKSWFRRQKVPESQWVNMFHTITSDHGFFHVHPASSAVSICKYI